MSEQQNQEEEGKEIFHLLKADEHHDDDKIKISVSSDNNIKISFFKLFKYSKFIQHQYHQNDIVDKITNLLQHYQSTSNIKKENISTFFKLLNDEQIEVSSDQYCDLCKLSEIFEVDSLQKLLDNYLENHCQNVDLMINLIIDQISTENFDFFTRNQFSEHIENCLRNNINKCIANENFDKLPCSTIYRIFEKSDIQQISSDILYDFISKSLNERFLLFAFLNIRNLSDEKFNDMYLHSIDLKKFESINYYNYLNIDLGYIKELKDDIQKSKNQNDILCEKNNQFQNELSQLKDQNEQMHNQIKELEILKDQLQSQINKLTNENKEIKTQNEQLKEEKSELQIQTNKLNTENNEIKVQKQKLEEEKNEQEIQIKNYIKEINKFEAQKLQTDNEKIQLQSQINKLKEDRDQSQTLIKQSSIDENQILIQKLEEYKKINCRNKEKEMHKYFELIKELLSHVLNIEKIRISGICLFFREQSCILRVKQETLNLLNISSH